MDVPVLQYRYRRLALMAVSLELPCLLIYPLFYDIVSNSIEDRFTIMANPRECISTPSHAPPALGARRFVV